MKICNASIVKKKFVKPKNCWMYEIRIREMHDIFEERFYLSTS